MRHAIAYFPGHGANPEPLTGSLTAENGAKEALVAATLDVVRLARSLPGVAGGVALLGHSMGSDVVVRTARRDGEVAATVAVSMFSPAVTADAPGNLLILVGAWEPAVLREEGLRVLAQVAGSDAAAAGRTFGSFARGDARRLEIVRGVEHIAVLYAQQSLVASREWLNAPSGGTAAVRWTAAGRGSRSRCSASSPSPGRWRRSCPAPRSGPPGRRARRPLPVAS